MLLPRSCTQPDTRVPVGRTTFNKEVVWMIKKYLLTVGHICCKYEDAKRRSVCHHMVHVSLATSCAAL